VKFEVPEDILEKTKKCSYKVSCLETGCCGDHPMCEIERSKVEFVSFLKTKKPVNCSYRIVFGGSQVCLCPTHFYIHKHNKTLSSQKKGRVAKRHRS